MPEKKIPRDPRFLTAAYYLSRCGVSQPPRALGVKTWAAAYDFFFSTLHEGRTPAQFHHSLKNARDAFDGHIDNTREGWKADLSDSSQRILQRWENRPDKDLEEWVLTRARGE